MSQKINILENDATTYFTEQQRKQTLPLLSMPQQLLPIQQLPQFNMHNQVDNFPTMESYCDILIHDNTRTEVGLTAEQYDAFLLYADADIDIAKYMYGVLNQMNFKVLLVYVIHDGIYANARNINRKILIGEIKTN